MNAIDRWTGKLGNSFSPPCPSQVNWPYALEDLGMLCSGYSACIPKSHRADHPPKCMPEMKSCGEMTLLNQGIKAIRKYRVAAKPHSASNLVRETHRVFDMLQNVLGDDRVVSVHIKTRHGPNP